MRAHGIMFHHFHDGVRHVKCQGSISDTELDDLISYYENDHRVLSADEFYNKALNDCLDPCDVCLCFDDGLLCQYEIAYPVLKNRNIRAFWFVYSSPLVGGADKLEIYHHFRFSKFSSIDDFYEAFYEIGCAIPGFRLAYGSKEAYEYKIAEAYYTENDRRFRYARDYFLANGQYEQVMDSMMERYNYHVEDYLGILWMKKNHIEKLHKDGHIIGLHSHTHPTVLGDMSETDQRTEYCKNKRILENITGDVVVAVAYPCNSYSIDTINIMEELGINIGFRANLANTILKSHNLEVPRADHADIVKEMYGT
jgi:peptidoglycan/xylan/chitin deacetylase (PgdA/CDA1 family)